MAAEQLNQDWITNAQAYLEGKMERADLTEAGREKLRTAFRDAEFTDGMEQAVKVEKRFEREQLTRLSEAQQTIIGQQQVCLDLKEQIIAEQQKLLAAKHLELVRVREFSEHAEQNVWSFILWKLTHEVWPLKYLYLDDN